MKSFASPKKVDNLSTLAHQLRELEDAHTAGMSVALSQTRNSLMAMIGDYTHTRYHLGRFLHVYKAFYKAERGWRAAAKVIAAALDRDERTVYRLIEDFERAAQVAPILLEAMEDQHIDPAAPKNADMIEDLVQSTPPASHEEAAEIVSSAIKAHDQRKATRQARRKAEPDFVHRVVSLFRARFARVPEEQAKEEMEKVLSRVAKELGVELAPRTLPLPNSPPLMDAA